MREGLPLCLQPSLSVTTMMSLCMPSPESLLYMAWAMVLLFRYYFINHIKGLIEFARHGIYLQDPL